MQVFKANLTVEQIHGRHGVFCVGALQTDIGTFKVKDSLLDQFQPGVYTGQFGVEKIYPKTVPWRHGSFTEIVAKLNPNAIVIDTDEGADKAAKPAVPPQVEPDPVDSEDGQQETVQASPTDVAAQAVSPVEAETLQGMFDDEQQKALANGQEIRLDSSINDRALFRRQRDYLKAQGYRFNAPAQSWFKP